MDTSALHIHSHPHSRVWSQPTQIALIVVIALSIIAMCTGTLFFLQAQGMSVAPFGVVSTLGEMGGAFLLAGGVAVSVVSFIALFALYMKHKQYSETASKEAREWGQQTLPKDQITYHSNTDAHHHAILRSGDQEWIIHTYPTKEEAHAHLERWTKEGYRDARNK